MNTPETKSVTSRWGPERRREFIDFRLQWDGRINRAELVDFFGISIQQASADLASYAEIAPDNLEYDKSAKVYRATAEFKPIFPVSDARHYLGQLADLQQGTASTANTFIGWAPPCDVIYYPARPVQTKTLLRVLGAIRYGEELQVTYQSMRRASPATLWIAPHAFGSDGLRWHVRAWSQEHSEFRDFVLSRIHAIKGSRKREVDPATDELWESHVDMVVIPRTGLTDDQRKAIEIDYGMKGGRLVINCRKALVWYALRQLQLDRSDDTPLLEQPLELANRDELGTLIAAAKKQPAGAATSQPNV